MIIIEKIAIVIFITGFSIGTTSINYASYLTGGILYFRKCIGIKYCAFINNYIKNQISEVRGGLIYCNSMQFFSNCNLSNNCIKCEMVFEVVMGGFIDAEKIMNHDNCIFYNNTSEMNKYFFHGNVLVANSVIN